ncbi:MAG: tetratricopeptide repeat protein [Planctomycetota bacterium]|nr:tetratricopeptide repeat protein [Planctomycetota bacterium]
MRRGVVLMFVLVVVFLVGCQSTQFASFVTYYPPKLKMPIGTAIAIVPKGGDVAGSDAVARRLEKFLSLEDPDKRFKIIEREALKDIMEERALAEVGLLEKDAEMLAKMKMKGVEMMIFVTVASYKSETIKITRQEKKVVQTTGAGAAFSKRGVTPVAGAVTQEQYVPVEYYTVRAEVEATFRMVNVGTREVVVPEAAIGQFQSEEARERIPMSEGDAREKAVNNCIAKFLQWITWVGKRETYELAAPPNDAAKVGNNLAAQGLFEQAEVQYNAALSAVADVRAKAAILYNLGIVTEAQGKYEEAKSCYEQAVSLTGGAARAYGEGLKRVEEKISLKAQPRPGEQNKESENK